MKLLTSPVLWNILSILGLTALLIVIIKIAYHYLKSKLDKTSFLWDSALLQSIYAPLVGYCLLSSLLAILIYLKKYVPVLDSLSAHLAKANIIALLVMFFWQLMRFIRSYEQTAVAHSQSRKNVSTIRAVSQLSRVTLILLVILICMQVLGLPISPILTFGGIGGIAIGFAAKDSLANMLGGLMLYIDRPFTIGDWIILKEKNIEGTVEHIGWRLTCIRTFDKRPLYIPNAMFSAGSIENASNMTNRRIKTTMGLRYEDANKIRDILGDIKQMLSDHPEIDNNATTLVNLVGFGDSSLNVLIYTFTKTTIWEPFQNIQEDVFLKILDIVQQHGAECAFPTRMLHLSEEWPTSDKPDTRNSPHAP